MVEEKNVGRLKTNVTFFKVMCNFYYINFNVFDEISGYSKPEFRKPNELKKACFIIAKCGKLL